MARVRTPEPSPENAFDGAHQAHQEFTADGKAGNESLFMGIEDLEKIGLQLIGTGDVSPVHFANVMLSVYHKVNDLEVLPPLSSDQTALVAGKVATYAAMTERAAPKPKRAAPKPTDITKAPTDKAKP